MKRNGLLVAAVISLAMCAGAGNLILNGRFEKDQEDQPPFWDYNPKYTSWTLNGGPGGIPSMKFHCPEGQRSGEVVLRQYGLALVSNGLYRMSCQLRTRDFKCKSRGAVAINRGWYQTAGVHNFPENSDWHLVAGDVKMVPSSDGEYSVAVYAIKFTGEMEVADFRLEPLSADAIAGSRSSKAGAAAMLPRLVPWDALLHEIPAATRSVEFRFYGHLPEGGGFGDYDVVSQVNGVKKAEQLPEKFYRFTVPGEAPDDGRFELGIVHRATGREIWRRGFNYTVVAPPPAAGKERRLNNLVTELADERFAAPGGVLEFAMPRRGWIFVKTEGGGTVKLDGATVINGATPRGETFREVAVGRHAVKVEAGQEARVIVRRIPEIFNYCPTVNSMVRENGDYDWAFMEKYILPAVTTLNGGNIPEAERAGVRARGYKWLANLGTTKLVDEADMKNRVEKAAGMNLPWYDGVTCDEQFFGQPDVLDRYTRGFASCANYDNDRLVYSWIVGKPGLAGLDQDYFATSLNCSRGRGRILFEAYCRTKADEASAREYLEDYVTDTYRRYISAYPLAVAGSGVIFGNFNQIPILSLTHHPEVDYKYYLDMQLNLLATNPEFRTLTCTGYWGSYYADEELHRWSFALLRHYCVEGATEMLSKKFGYSYIPGHLENGDFRGKLAPWRADGKVSLGEHNGFGGRSQNRWGGNGHLGDTYAVLEPGANGEAAGVAQRVKGLVAGRRYVFQFVVADAADVKANRIAPRRFPVKSEVVGGTVDAARSWVHVDRRVKGRYTQNNGVARINLHHVVFTATAPEAEVRVVTEGAKPGENLAVNCVSLNPYAENL